MRSRATAEKIAFTINIDKRVTIGAVVAAIIVIFGFGWNASTANSRIAQLEKDTSPISAINERTIRIEEQVSAIRSAVERRP